MNESFYHPYPTTSRSGASHNMASAQYLRRNANRSSPVPLMDEGVLRQLTSPTSSTLSALGAITSHSNLARTHNNTTTTTTPSNTQPQQAQSPLPEFRSLLSSQVSEVPVMGGNGFGWQEALSHAGTRFQYPNALVEQGIDVEDDDWQRMLSPSAQSVHSLIATRNDATLSPSENHVATANAQLAQMETSRRASAQAMQRLPVHNDGYDESSTLMLKDHNFPADRGVATNHGVENTLPQPTTERRVPIMTDTANRLIPSSTNNPSLEAYTGLLGYMVKHIDFYKKDLAPNDDGETSATPTPSASLTNLAIPTPNPSVGTPATLSPTPGPTTAPTSSSTPLRQSRKAMNSHQPVMVTYEILSSRLRNVMNEMQTLRKEMMRGGAPNGCVPQTQGMPSLMQGVPGVAGLDAVGYSDDAPDMIAQSPMEMRTGTSRLGGHHTQAMVSAPGAAMGLTGLEQVGQRQFYDEDRINLTVR